MRITNQQMAFDTIAGAEASMSQVQQTTLELSTGKAVNQPSDNPQAAGQIVELNSQISLNTGYTAAAQSGDSEAALSASVLGQVMTLLNSVQSAAETGLNSATMSPADLNALAQQVNANLGQILNLANTQSNGQSIFAGFQTQSQAFTATTSGGVISAVAYNGDSGVNRVPVGQGLSEAVNLPGNSVFDAPGASVFASVISVAQALSSGNQSALSAGLTQLQAAMATVTTSQAQAGAMDQALQHQNTVLSGLNSGLNTLLGQTQNADMATVATAYQQALIAYQSGIQAAGSVAQLPSIVNYL